MARLKEKFQLLPFYCQISEVFLSQINQKSISFLLKWNEGKINVIVCCKQWEFITSRHTRVLQRQKTRVVGRNDDKFQTFSFVSSFASVADSGVKDLSLADDTFPVLVDVNLKPIC